MRRLLLIALFAVVPRWSAAQSTETPLAFIDRLTDAGVRRDVAALQALYAPDYFHTNADGSVMTLAGVLESYAAPPPMTIVSSKHDEERVLTFSGAAVVSMRVTIGGLAGQTPWTRRYRVTYVLSKEGGRWLAKNSHASLLSAP